MCVSKDALQTTTTKRYALPSRFAYMLTRARESTYTRILAHVESLAVQHDIHTISEAMSFNCADNPSISFLNLVNSLRA